MEKKSIDIEIYGEQNWALESMIWRFFKKYFVFLISLNKSNSRLPTTNNWVFSANYMTASLEQSDTVELQRPPAVSKSGRLRIERVISSLFETVHSFTLLNE